MKKHEREDTEGTEPSGAWNQYGVGERIGAQSLILMMGVIRCKRWRSQAICDLIAFRCGRRLVLFDKWYCELLAEG